MSKITTCQESLAAWNSGASLTSVNISGMPMVYELCCQRIMFAAIGQVLHAAGDAEYWDALALAGSDPREIFTDASALARAEGMSGAQFHYSTAAAVVMLRNGWAGGRELAPPDRLFEVRNPEAEG